MSAPSSEPLEDIMVSDGMKTFGNAATSLARNPLGIIALFIVLVYGFASLVITFSSSFTPAERLPLVYFMIVFPVLVLGVFAWLVSKHSSKLFAPGDFQNEENYVKIQMGIVASLSAASAKNDSPGSDARLTRIVDLVLAVRPVAPQAPDGWKKHILWVDDCPDNNIHERRAFEALGLQFTLARSTDEALERLSLSKFAAIISDIKRAEGPEEGYVLLEKLRKKGDHTPMFFYSAFDTITNKRKTHEHGGQGYTNDVQELFEMVMKSLN